jgi:hypothetical protein
LVIKALNKNLKDFYFSENEKKDVKRIYLDKIADKYKGKEVVMIVLRKVPKITLGNNKKSAIKGIGGPIYAQTRVYQIDNRGYCGFKTLP